MAHSTSPASRPRSEPTDRFGLAALEGFYRLHAPVYDWTRPLLLCGRRAAVRALALRPGELVLDVGCGTGYSLPHLLARGARVVGIEPSTPMRRRAERRLERQLLGHHVVELDPRPYGSHADYAGRAHALLFSYSLSMIPPYAEVLERARADLRPGGRLAVVDFLEAWGPVGLGLRQSHVALGRDRLGALERAFPCHRLEIHSAGLWRYFQFTAERLP